MLKFPLFDLARGAGPGEGPNCGRWSLCLLGPSGGPSGRLLLLPGLPGLPGRARNLIKYLFHFISLIINDLTFYPAI